MNYSDLVTMLRGVHPFSELAPAKQKLLAFSSAYLTFEAGELLVHQGEPADSVYIIKSGEVEIILRCQDQEIIIGRLGHHQLFGELAVLLNRPRMASIRAIGQVIVLKIDADVFLRLITENAEGALAVMRSLCEKLLLSTGQLNRSQPANRASGTAEAIV